MKKIIILLALVGLLGEGYCVWTHRGGNKSNLKYYFGMVPDAYSPKEFSNEDVQSLSYWAKINYPAESVIHYYEESLKTKGWAALEVNESGAQRKWTSGIKVDPGSTVPACGFTYFAAWVNAAKNRLTQLTIVYYDPAPNKICPQAPQNNECLVTMQEIPYGP